MIAALPLLLTASVAGANITVVTTSGVPAYGEALEGLRAALGSMHSVRVVDARDPRHAASLESVVSPPSSELVVTIGADALAAVRRAPHSSPLVSTMTVGGKGRPVPPISGEVRLYPAFERILAEMRRLYPEKNRMGVIYNPLSGVADMPTWKSKARQEGYTLVAVACGGPDGLLKAFRQLNGKADFLLAAPDSSLYSAATVKPLVLASIEYGIPIVGFSASFVRAGAAIGIYPDYRDLGRQTAEVVRRCLAGESVVEDARKLLVAANPRVMRLLGIKPGAGSGKEVLLVE